MERPLPGAELDVLGCLWQRDEATAREIREAMEGYRPMAHGSVVTLLKRLEAKGLVTKRKGAVGKAFVYRPTRRLGPTYRRMLKTLLDRVFGGDGVALVASLFEGNPPTAEELDDLQDLLDQLRGKAREGGNEK